jgi:hypothetical protein
LQAEESFKGLRRKLPKTKQEFNWQVRRLCRFFALCGISFGAAASRCCHHVSSPFWLPALSAGPVQAFARARADGTHANKEQLGGRCDLYYLRLFRLYVGVSLSHALHRHVMAGRCRAATRNKLDVISPKLWHFNFGIYMRQSRQEGRSSRQEAQNRPVEEC